MIMIIIIIIIIIFIVIIIIVLNNNSGHGIQVSVVFKGFWDNLSKHDDYHVP